MVRVHSKLVSLEIAHRLAWGVCVGVLGKERNK